MGRIARAHRDENARVAEGGANALRGFRFQLEVALLKSLEGAAFNTAEEREAFTEVLSDIVARETSEPVLVVQTKLRQSSTAVRSGLEELFSIHKTAVTQEPRWAEQVEYGLVFRSGDPLAAREATERWAAKDPARRQGFAERVRFEVQSNPGATIVDLLANRFEVEDPIGLHAQWIGELLNAATFPMIDERAAQTGAVGRAIARTLAHRHSAYPLGVYLLQQDDAAPKELQRGEVLLGQQPAVHHLVDGYFAERPRELSRARNHFLRWMEERESSRREGTVPVFWIGGRSGSGKSVLLLQFLSSLRQEGWDPILWLGNKSRLLPDAAQWIHGWSPGEAPPLIGLDDPYGPNGPRDESWHEFLAKLGSQVQTADERRIPIVVCCGPTEQFDQLRSDFEGELELQLFELTHELPEEMEELRSWYHARTGVEAPGRAEENVLLVQLFFEWGTGEPLRHFAAHFQQRIKDAGGGDSLLPLLAEMLALNRLYVGFPVAAKERRLSPGDKDLLAQLRREEHLTEEGEEGRPGVWLAHPHLSNGIYDVWFPPEKCAHERRDHFERAALECVESGSGMADKWAPIQAVVLESKGRGYGVAHRIDATVTETLPTIYARTRELHEDRLSITELALWIEVEEAQGISFEPRPVDDALSLLTSQATRLSATGRLCEMLLKGIERLDPPRAAALLGIIERLLRENPEWPAWGRVAAAALAVSERSALAAIVRNRLVEHGTMEAAGWVLTPLLKAADEDEIERLRKGALRLLESNLHHRSWSWVWAPFWEREKDPQLREIGLLWLRSCPRDAGWSFVWRSIYGESLKDRDTRRAMVELAMEWLQENFENTGWGGVWTALWETDPQREMPQLAKSWLDQTDPTLPSYSFVWCGLWRKGWTDASVRALGLEALRRFDDTDRSWGQIFPLLYGSFPGPELRGVGVRWLRTAPPNAPAWGHVLPALWKVALENGDSEMLDQLEPHAQRFLRDAGPGHAGWIYVFDLLWHRHRSSPQRELGMKRLELSPEESGAAELWVRLWEDADDSDELATWAAEWLPNRHRHVGWSFVWKRLCLETSVEAGRLEEGERWILDAPLNDRNWSPVFSTLWSRHRTPALRDRAVQWLERKRENKAWDIVWRYLLAYPGPERDMALLRDLGLSWLQSRPQSPRWPVVWTALWAGEPSEGVRRLGVEWLGGPGTKARLRSRVHKSLQADEEEVSLHALAWSERANRVRIAVNNGQVRLLPQAMEITAEGAPTNGEADREAWLNLWSDLWPWVRTAALREAAIRWLRAHADTETPGFKHVWHELWESGRRRQLFEIGCAYLSVVESSKKSWMWMWEQLWQAEATPHLHELGSDWLERNASATRSRVMRQRLSEPRLLD